MATAAFGAGPFAPAAGQPGSTAISMDDPRLVGWATDISLQRGYLDISQPMLGLVDYGAAENALGKAQGNSMDVVSLGDGGVATLRFGRAIRDGDGPDFAVFENSFSDTYLELAFVEVSSDGTNFVRFDAVSLTPTDTQKGAFDPLDPTDIHNLAGKYRQGYGTPFDLAELAGSPELDIDHISHIRVLDAVGSLDDAYATYDSQAHKVNDPWSSPFASGGFDLDAVGVLHQAPEPGSVVLLATAAASFAWAMRRRRRAGKDGSAKAG